VVHVVTNKLEMLASTLSAAAMHKSATICIGTHVRPWAHLARPAMTGLFKAPVICLLLVVGSCLLSLPSAEQQHMFANMMICSVEVQPC